MESNKRIPCKQCEKSYVHRKDLLRHIRNKHGDKQDQPKSRSLLKRTVVDDSGGATKKIKLRPPSPMVVIDDPEIKVFVQKNIEAIQKRKRVHRACQSFNFPLKSNNITPGLLLTHLNEIYDQASGKFKVQMGIGRILRNKENGELKYWRAEHCDSHLLQNQKVVQPLKVNSRSDLKGIAEKAANLATEDYLESTRPDTKWELVMPTNVRYYISYTDFVAGYITENLPDYLLNKESVNCLHRDYANHNNFYQDNLCFFRCLAYHKLKHDKDHKLMCIGRPLNLLTHQLYYDYNKDVNQHRNQEQVGLDQLLELESYFKVNIEVYRCHEDSDKVDHVYKSIDEPGRGEKLYLDLYVGDDENHFSYINNMQAYSHRFQCMKCEQDFHTAWELNRHETVCDGDTATKPVFVGGFKKLWPTLFERLQHYGIEINPEDRYYEHFIVFDCESILRKTEEQQQARKWTAEHIPVSIAMSASFLPLNPKTGFPSTKCVVRSSPEELVREFLRLLMKWREPLLMHLNEKYQYVFDILNEKLQESQEILQDCEESEKKWEKKWNKGLVELKQDLEKYIQMVPVLGFNSAKYDLNLLRQQLITTYLREYGGEVKVIKQQSAYSKIDLGGRLRFLDVYKYCSPNTNLDSFMKAEGVVGGKFFFPYEWFDSYEKLDHPELPPAECFYSSLRQTNVLGDSPEEIQANYKLCQDVWQREGMKTFKSFLAFYNRMDVAPMVTACKSWLRYYHDTDKIDVLKDTIGLPSIARRRMYEAASKFPGFMGFSLTENSHQNLEKLIVSNTCGGPSIVFTRYHEAGKTRLRELVSETEPDGAGDHTYCQPVGMSNGAAKLCEGVLGYDTNSLYPWCESQLLPVGPCVHYEVDPTHPEGWFKPTLVSKKFSQLQMNYCLKQDGMKHKWNTGSEVKIGPFFVDGFWPEEQKITELAGCHWHGCVRCKKYRNDEQRKRYQRTIERAQFIYDRTDMDVEIEWECEIDNNPIFDNRQPNMYRYYCWKKSKNRKATTINPKLLLKMVEEEVFFGMMEVDIEVPPHLMDHFEEFCPLFVTCSIPTEAIGDTMQQYIEENNLSKLPRRQLVAGRKARRILLTTPLLNWYLKHGLVVTKVYQAVEWQFQRCLKKFFMEIASERRQAAQDPSRAAHANKQKLTGTSAYGATLLNKEKFDNIYYVGENEALLKHNDPKFRSSTYIGDGIYEVHMAHKVMKNDIPKQIGLFVLQYAKLRMLQFYYDCLDRYLDRSDFEMSQMDTDSLYFAVSKYDADQLDDLASHPLIPMVKEGLLDEFKSKLYDHCEDDWQPDFTEHYFPRQCCAAHNQYDQKTPGLFKLEKSGTGIVGLCSKTYCLQVIGGQEKIAVKGINKSTLSPGVYQQMLDVLQTGDDKMAVNRGFRMHKASQDNNNCKMMTYQESKKAFNYLYCKRQVLEDKIHTKPLDIVLEPDHS